MQGYIFGGKGMPQTPQELERMRQMAEALAANSASPKNVGEGLSSIGNAIAYRALMKRADKGEAAGRESANSAFAKIAAAMNGGATASPAAPQMDYPTQRVAQAHAPEAAPSMASAGDIEAYIRQAAQKRGIEPDTAVKVAMSEGGVTDPFRQSDFVKNGVREQSYGPFQLYMGGGMGNDAMAAGIDPRKDWKGGVDFALDQAKEGGWGPWYGAKRVGITGMEGIGQSQASPAVAQVAQAMPQPSMQEIMDAASNPFLSDGQKMVVGALLKQRFEPKKYDFISGRDGAIFRGDPSAGTLDQVYGGKPDQFRVLSNDEEVKMGLDTAGSYQIGPDNKVGKIGGEGTTVNIDQKTEGAFDKKLAEKDAETYSTMSQEGMNAKADLGIIGELGTLLKGQGGAMTGLQGWLAQKGVDVGEATSDLQAAQALINKLVPTQRQPGSGSMSDRDVELFTRSLPSLWNQPGGNEKILTVMQGLAQYKLEQGRIADMVVSGQMSRQDARKALMSLPNPLAGFEAPELPKSERKKVIIDGATIEEID